MKLGESVCIVERGTRQILIKENVTAKIKADCLLQGFACRTRQEVKALKEKLKSPAEQQTDL